MLCFFSRISTSIGLHVILYPLRFFGLASILFSVLLYMYSVRFPLSLQRLAAILFITIAAGGLVFYLTGYAAHWSVLRVMLTCFCLVMVFSSMLPAADMAQRIKNLLVTGCSFCLFIYMGLSSMATYDALKENREYYQKMIHWLDQHAPHKSVLFFNTWAGHTFPVLTFSKSSSSASRFSFFWFLPTMLMQAYFPSATVLNADAARDKDFFAAMMAEDLARKKPEFVFVDRMQKKFNLYYYTSSEKTGNTKKIIAFDYLRFFARNPLFRALWKNWHYRETLVQTETLKINPLTGIFLLSPSLPDDRDIIPGRFLLYLTPHDKINLAVKNGFGQVYRITVSAGKNGLSRMEFRRLKEMLQHRGTTLSLKDEDLLSDFLYRQIFHEIFYQYDIYERGV